MTLIDSYNMEKTTKSGCTRTHVHILFGSKMNVLKSLSSSSKEQLNDDDH